MTDWLKVKIFGRYVKVELGKRGNADLFAETCRESRAFII